MDSGRRMRLITVKMPEELLAALDEAALREGITRSELLRRAVFLYVSGHCRPCRCPERVPGLVRV